MDSDDKTEEKWLIDIMNGNRDAKKRLVEALTPIINRQTSIFCKRYCYDQHYTYQCTLQPPLRKAQKNTTLCEWGNASYEWMLSELSNDARLNKFEGRDGAKLINYLFVIANSIPFYERWKDWRFGNHVYVPVYIKDLHPKAGQIFRGLKAQTNLPTLAQQAGLALDEITSIARKITRDLIARNRLHLLVATTELAVDHTGENAHEFSVAADTTAPEVAEDIHKMSAVFNQLPAVEKFVLESFYVDELSAKEILRTLDHIDWQQAGLDKLIQDVQQLYYVRRKSLVRLLDLYQHTTR